MKIMNILTKTYTEIRRYGEILDDEVWEDNRGNLRRMLIKYEGVNYDIVLLNGEAIEIVTADDYNKFFNIE
jgi:hypothetical protein